MATATLSSQNQIVVPREAREALGVQAGDQLLIVVRGDTVIILPRPKSFTKAFGGLDKVALPKDHHKHEPSTAPSHRTRYQRFHLSHRGQ